MCVSTPLTDTLESLLCIAFEARECIADERKRGQMRPRKCDGNRLEARGGQLKKKDENERCE